MFSTGASGLVNEYVLATVTTYILGNSIEQFSIVIALMMLMMGVSGLVQRHIGSKNLIEKFLGIEILMAIAGGFAPLAIYAAYAYLNDHFMIVNYGFILLVGFLIGFEIPVVMRIVESKGIELTRNLSVVYAMDYIGAFIGAIIWVKFLLKTFPLTEISFIVAGFNFIVACIAISYFMFTNEIKRFKRTIAAIMISVACILIWGFKNNIELSKIMEQRLYDDPIVHSETTKYQHLVITENKNTGDVRLYINGSTQFSSLDEKRYHEFLVHPALAIAPKKENVLILGGGDGLAVREIKKYEDVKNIQLVDLDPAIVDLAKHNPLIRELNEHAFEDARINTANSTAITSNGVKPLMLSYDESSEARGTKEQWVTTLNVQSIDAANYLRTTSGVWDVVIIDFPDPSSVEVGKLYSKEFYNSLQRVISEDSIIAIQATSPYHSKDVYLSIKETMEYAGYKTLPYRQNIPSFGDWGFLLATPIKNKNNLHEELKKVSSFEVSNDFITPELLIASLAFGKNELNTGRKCINSLMQPCIVQMYNEYGWIIE
ncbi:spermidine synthase [Oleiphilus sp. HI0009]|nr:spermidine synthase [Oleiphilus sp. HI0009]